MQEEGKVRCTVWKTGEKIWICLLTVVIAAILIGVIYYYSAPQEQGTEGFLIREQREESYVF